MSKTLIITDPGHGGINPTAGKYTTFPNKCAFHDGMTLHDGGWFYEGVFNRQVEALLHKKLEIAGLPYVSTIAERPNWEDLPLNSRTTRANALAKRKRALFVSIHANAFDGSTSGFEVFCNPGSRAGAKLAWHILDHFVQCLPPEIRKARLKWNERGPAKEKAYYVLRNTSMPAVLVEVGFMDNKNDLAALMSPHFQDKAAQAIADAIMCYLGNSPIQLQQK